MNQRQFVLRINRKGFALLTVVIMISALGRLLCSEVLNLVATYPSPFGIYNQIVTTGDSGTSPADTTLNRNAGNTILVPSSNVAGKVGIGTTSPAQKLEIAGDVKAESGRFTAGVQLGDAPLTCVSEKAGALRWHSGKFEGCDGGAWKDLQGNGGDNPKCAEAGGAWSANQSICYFSSNSCPAGWTTTTVRYTSTEKRTCYRDKRSCTTKSHFRIGVKREMCIVSGYGCMAALTESGCKAVEP